MKLVPVFFEGPSGTGLPYRKAMVYEEDLEFFIGKGASRELDDVNIAEIVIEPTVDKAEKTGNPDKGWGEPGTLEWATNSVNAMESSKEIGDFVVKVTGKKIDTEKSVPIARGIAKTMLKEHYSK